jgi:hypothetical protein
MSVGQGFRTDEISGAAMSAPRPSLQSLLLEAGAASEEELRHAFEEAQLRGLRLGDVVLSRGWLSQEGLAKLIARQWSLPFLARESLGLDPAAAELLSTEQALELRACVIGISNGGPLAVVAEPTTERLGSLSGLLGAAAHFAVVTESSLERLLEQRARVKPSPHEVESGEPAPIVEEVPLEPAPAQSIAPIDLVAVDDTETDALVAELEQATAGLSAARERIEQLAGARRGAEQMVADLNQRLTGIDQERVREQERSRDLEAQLEAARERSRSFRRRLAELLAEFED